MKKAIIFPLYVTLLLLSSIKKSSAMTNAKSINMPAVVRLSSTEGDSSICTGTVVGRDPVVVLTAFHCINDLKTGKVMILPSRNFPQIDIEHPDYIFKNSSTQVIFHDAVKTHPYYLSLVETEVYVQIGQQRLVETQKELSRSRGLHVNDLELQRLSQRAQVQGGMLAQIQKNYNSILNKLLDNMNLGTFHDVAYLVFENSDRFDSLTSTETLIEDHKLIPLNFSHAPEGELVLLAGFGIDRVNGNRPASELMGGVNFLQRPSTNGVIKVVYGVEGTHESIVQGTMSAILEGDSGGPLLGENGLVGVTSRTRDVTDGDREISPNWPLNKYNRYSYLHGEFISVNASQMLELIDKLRANGFDVEESNGQVFYDFAHILDLDSQAVQKLQP